jgi:hypothetical protein
VGDVFGRLRIDDTFYSVGGMPKQRRRNPGEKNGGSGRSVARASATVNKDVESSVVVRDDVWRAEASHNSNNMERHIAARWQQGRGASHNSMETAATAWSVAQQFGGGNTMDHG